ncbi:MAG: amino acid permease [Candidatus Aminicenantes bacterium]|nr:amino acid permease [Candidatus Aminicenantes bacterium]
MGLFDATSLVVGAVIGSGIFLTSGIIADYLPSSGMMLIAWFAAGLVTILGALCYGELGSMYPRAGGAYVYLKEAFGPVPAFLFGWTFFIIIGAAGVAAIAMGFAEYFESLVPIFTDGEKILGVNGPQVIAVAAIVGLSFFNVSGLRTSYRGQTFITVIRLAVLGVMIAAGIIFGLKTGGKNLQPVFPSGGNWPSLTAWGAAIITALWSFDGWYSVACTAEEIRNPKRNVPRALVMGTALVMIIYLAVNLVYGLTLPIEGLRGTIRVGEAAFITMAGPSAAPVFSAVVALTIFGCLSANIFYCARVPYAMARDGLFFPTLGRLHPRKGIPVRALWAQTAVAGVLILTGTFQRLVDYVLFGLVAFFAATGAALIVLRRKEPGRDRPYRLRLYPFIPLAFIAVNSAIFIALALEHPGQAVVALLLICSGGPAFFIWNARRKVNPPGNEEIPGGQ